MTIDHTRQLLLTKFHNGKDPHGHYVSKIKEESPLPIPHGSTYRSLSELIADVMQRCTAAGMPLVQSINVVKQVASQLEGAPA